MHALVRSAAHDIERNLLIDGSQCQQALFETFVRADARSRGAVMAIGGTVVMANTVAAVPAGAVNDGSSSSYSSTTVQVAGVDEGDVT